MFCCLRCLDQVGWRPLLVGKAQISRSATTQEEVHHPEVYSTSPRLVVEVNNSHVCTTSRVPCLEIAKEVVATTVMTRGRVHESRTS